VDVLIEPVVADRLLDRSRARSSRRLAVAGMPDTNLFGPSSSREGRERGTGMAGSSSISPPPAARD
jgi:hypothetical protein